MDLARTRFARAAELTRSGAPLAEQSDGWRQACEVAPRSPSPWSSWVDVLLGAGRPDVALKVLAKALECLPDEVGFWLRRSVLLRQAGALEEAEQHLRRALALAPDHPEILANLAYQLQRRRRGDEALALAEHACREAPGHPLAMLVRAKVHHSRGELESAAVLFDSVRTSRRAPPLHRASAGMGLAQVLDALGHHAEAWTAAEQAQAARRALEVVARLDGDWLPRQCRQADAAWQHAPGVSPLPPSEQPPVFLLGFIRSGTTLLEQIIAATGIPTSDEAPLLDRTMDWLAQQSPAYAASGVAALEELDPALLARARVVYREQAAAQLGATQRWVDKMPLHLVQLPLIRALFPSAPVLVMLRDPRDCVVSTFLQDLTLNAANLHFTELQALGRSYVQVMGLWARWRQWALPGVHEVRYEELVSDPLAVSRRVVAQCSLTWCDEVERFHERASKRAIITPSVDAVGRPVHRAASGRWRSHADRLAPIEAELAPLITAFGYDEG